MDMIQELQLLVNIFQTVSVQVWHKIKKESINREQTNNVYLIT